MAGHGEWELLRLGWRAIPRALHRGFSQGVARFWTAFGCLSLLVWLVFFVQIPGCVFQSKMAQCKQNLHEVQLAIERFAVDSPRGNYPRDPGEVIAEGYLTEMPYNPFTGSPMRWVVLAAVDYSAPRPPGLSHGDFGYCPRSDRLPPIQSADFRRLAPESIFGYSLILY
jgi:hypothetical protein